MTRVSEVTREIISAALLLTRETEGGDGNPSEDSHPFPSNSAPLADHGDISLLGNRVAKGNRSSHLNEEIYTDAGTGPPSTGGWEGSLPSSGLSPSSPLSHDHIRLLLRGSDGYPKRGWKKSRRRDKTIPKKYLKTKYRRGEARPESKGQLDSQLVTNQLDELRHLQNPLEESEDEIHDAEILRAVYTSVVEHQRNWLKRILKKLLRKHRVKRDEEVVCYADLGCFRDDGPFDYFDTLPNPPDEVNTKFLLYTKENPDREQYLSYTNSTSFRKSNFRPTRKTKVIVHGFGSSCFRVWVRGMKETLLKMEDVNVICVQWEDGASTPNYVRAASNSRLVGAQLALFLGLAVRTANMSLTDVHLIGFSLGAHVSGYAGERLNGRIGRISGLDPAGPLFESFPPTMRLDKTDAAFVDVIHTNADSLLWGGLGAYDPMGHVDFYPNGGRVQRGCKNLFVGGVSDILWPKEGDGRYLCNHRRGYKYFMESIIPVCKFPAFACKDYDTFQRGDCFPCKDCGNMGYYADKSPGRGMMFLVTRDTEPFCANQFKLEIWHSGGPPTTDPVSTQGKFDVTFVASDGKNETLDVTKETGEKKMHAGSRTISIVVLHPALTEITSLQVTYSSFRGWLSSGFNKWAIDKVILMSNTGTIQSFCHRGLTMESGLTMTFPLVPGDCNTRDLTPMPHPVRWHGIDYNVKNGVSTFQSPPRNPSSALGPPYDFSGTLGPNLSIYHSHPTPRPHIQQHAIKTSTDIHPPPPRRPNDSSTTFSVFHDFPISLGNETGFDLGPMKFADHGTTAVHNEKMKFDDTMLKSAPAKAMTKEEFMAWRDAPPPNLKTTNSGDKIVDKSPNEVIDNSQPVNIIPAPQLDKEHNTKEILPEGLAIKGNVPRKTDVTITPPKKSKTDVFSDNNQSKRKDKDSVTTNASEGKTKNQTTVLEKYHGSEPILQTDESSKSKIEIRHQSPTEEGGSRSKPQSHVVRLQGTKNSLDTVDNLNEKMIVEDLPFNSVIDGEIPMKERARSISFKTPLNANVNPDEKTNERVKDSHEKVVSGVKYSGREETRRPHRGILHIETSHLNNDRFSHSIRNTDTPSIGKEVAHISHSVQRPSNHKIKGSWGKPFTNEHYSFTTPHSFDSHIPKGHHHTLPPTMLRPPALKKKNEFTFPSPPSAFHTHHHLPIPPPVQAQYSDLYSQHRYYPRPPTSTQPLDGNHDSNSESSYISHVKNREPVFVPTENAPNFFPQPKLSSQLFPSNFNTKFKESSKRLLNPFSFLSSLRKAKENRGKRFPKGLLFGSKGAPNTKTPAHSGAPNTNIPVHSDRVPYHLPPYPPHVHQIMRFPLPTHHLRAPPPGSGRGNLGPPRSPIHPISRADIGRRSFEREVPPKQEEEENFENEQERTTFQLTYARRVDVDSGNPGSKVPSAEGGNTGTEDVLRIEPMLDKTIKPVSEGPKASFIPIRVSRSPLASRFPLLGNLETMELKKASKEWAPIAQISTSPKT